MNNNNFKNKTSGLPTGKMKQNNKNAAITQLFNERNQIVGAIALRGDCKLQIILYGK